MIKTLLPPGVFAVEARQDNPEEFLFPAEEKLLGRAVPKRRAEFTTARGCARRALTQLGFPPVPILSEPSGAPVWPDAVVGSITHCVGYRAAAVGRSEYLRGLGIDAEPNQPLPPGTDGLVLRARERAELEKLRSVRPAVHWDRLVFSAKEAAFKAWYPRTERWLEFDDAWVGFDDGDHFTVTIAPDSLTHYVMNGRWVLDSGLLLTAVADPIFELHQELK